MYEVIIVEDDPMVAMINKQYVNQHRHFNVSAVCNDGITALEYMEKNIVHLAIVDKYMPRMDGLELLCKIREKNLSIYIIMVTAANDSNTIEESLRLGIVDYLVKPFNNIRFGQALDKFLNMVNTLHNIQSFDQQKIDKLIDGNTAENNKGELPKGIQTNTLDTICDFLKSNYQKEFTSEEIAVRIGLSRVTVRRYMNYLIENCYITGHMNYETGGRPCMIYRWNK